MTMRLVLLMTAGLLLAGCPDNDDKTQDAGVADTDDGEVLPISEEPCVWRKMESPVVDELGDIWGSAPGNVYAVGYGGTVLHYGGSNWSPMKSEKEVWLKAIHGLESGDLYAIGKGAVLRLEAEKWVEVCDKSSDHMFRLSESQLVSNGGELVISSEGCVTREIIDLGNKTGGRALDIWVNEEGVFYTVGESTQMGRYDGQ